jgi:hypothetical protein
MGKCVFTVKTPGGRFTKHFPATPKGYVKALKRGRDVAGQKVRGAGNVADVFLECESNTIFVATCDPALREKDMEGNIFCTTRFSQRGAGFMDRPDTPVAGLRGKGRRRK